MAKAKSARKPMAGRNGRKSSRDGAAPKEEKPVSEMWRALAPLAEKARAAWEKEHGRRFTRRDLEREIREIRNG